MSVCCGFVYVVCSCMWCVCVLCVCIVYMLGVGCVCVLCVSLCVCVGGYVSGNVHMNIDVSVHKKH